MNTSCLLDRLLSGLSLTLAGLGSSGLGAAELPTATSSLFSASGNCAFCHDQWGGALTDRRGHNVSITEDWRGTVMAHAFKDPLWRAVMELETAENPELKGFIEDKCQTCHAPMGRTQERHEAGKSYAYAQAKKSELAADGVSCSLCHQIQPDNLGKTESFTGHYEIKDTRQIFGPYRDVFTMPMMHHVDYEPQFGAHTQESALCATCHTLYTPVLGKDGRTIGQFPEQVPFLEWRSSDYARQGKHCQDCHMPRLDEPIKISARPPWLEGRQPFWRHAFVGGNAFMLQLIADHERAIKPHADDTQLAVTIERAREQLRRAARLDVNAERQEDVLVVQVDINNLTGHKFPTGHPYRRAWLHVLARDARGRVIFESGAIDVDGRLVGSEGSYLPHEDVITRPEQVQVYEAVMGDSEERRTYALLRASTYLKDNRIPPRGFDADGPEGSPDVAVRGKAAHDENFHAKSTGADHVTYLIELGRAEGEIQVQVDLLYQSVPPEAVDRLMKSKGEAARAFRRFYRAADKRPEVVQAVTVRLN